MENVNKTIAQKIRNLRDTLPNEILEKYFKLQPLLKKNYQEKHIKLYKEDTQFHLSYLAESIEADEPILLNEYFRWAKTFFLIFQ